MLTCVKYLVCTSYASLCTLLRPSAACATAGLAAGGDFLNVPVRHGRKRGPEQHRPCISCDKQDVTPNCMECQSDSKFSSATLANPTICSRLVVCGAKSGQPRLVSKFAPTQQVTRVSLQMDSKLRISRRRRRRLPHGCCLSNGGLRWGQTVTNLHRPSQSAISHAASASYSLCWRCLMGWRSVNSSQCWQRCFESLCVFCLPSGYLVQCTNGEVLCNTRLENSRVNIAKRLRNDSMRVSAATNPGPRKRTRTPQQSTAEPQWANSSTSCTERPQFALCHVYCTTIRAHARV